MSEKDNVDPTADTDYDSSEHSSDSEGSGLNLGSVELNPSRRSLIAGVTGLGVLTALGSTQAAAQVGSNMEFGGGYSGSTSNGSGLELRETTQDGSWTTGIEAYQNSSSGAAVYGLAKSSTGSVFGVFGQSGSPSGKGITGRATNTSGNNIGLLGVTDSSSGTGLQGEARAATGGTVGLRGFSVSPSGEAVRGNNTAGSGNTIGVGGYVSSPDGYGLYTPDNCLVEGNLEVQGTKNFVQSVDTPSGSQQIAYTAVEAGKAHTEVSESVELTEGKAEIELPDHFTMVTSESEELIVQLTPYAEKRAHPQVVEKSIEKIVVMDFGDELDEYTVSYTVKGVREGFEDVEVMR